MENKYSIENSNTFLSIYNQIDTYFSYILGLDKYISYHEKLSLIIEGDMPITSLVRLYQHKLRYFGELRNQLVHGFRLDKNHYILVSDHALKEIKLLHDEIKKPTNVLDTFGRTVYTCCVDDLLVEVIKSMKEHLNTHVPVYDKQGMFVEMLSESTIAYWVAEQIGDDGEIHLRDIRVGDISLENSNDCFVFVHKEKSIYEIEELFAKKRTAKKRLGAVFITRHGKKEETIEGIITAMDTPLLSDHFIL